MARLDIMHPRLWGRAESIRTVAQMGALAAGPLLFGFISAALGGPHTSTSTGGAVPHSDALAYTFLIMLVPVALAGVILVRAKRTYPSDVATAAASVAATGADRRRRLTSPAPAGLRRSRRAGPTAPAGSARAPRR